jgi:signal transduction histidine kinase
VDNAAPDEPSADAERFTVDHQGERLGIVTLQMRANDPMNPTKERLVRDVAGQASLVLRNVLLIEDLRESRRRIVSAQDERARALERNIHDGAQQQLVALSVKLRLVDGMLEGDTAKAREVLAQLQTETNETLEDLRDLARGIYPPLLADKGLAAALEAQARKAALRVSVDADGIERYPQEIESAVYFSVLEALNNVAKYAGTEAATVTLANVDGHLTFTVRDEGAGFDMTSNRSGTGLQGIADRLEAIGGSFQVDSAPGRGTTIIGRIDVQAEVAAVQASSSRSGPNTALGM